jgi:enoyl-CoA hydratase
MTKMTSQNHPAEMSEQALQAASQTASQAPSQAASQAAGQEPQNGTVQEPVKEPVQEPVKEPAPFTLQWRDGGAVFTICRPAKLNAITRPVLEGLEHCLQALPQRGARWLVVTGEGERAFCAGTDLAEAAAMSPQAMADKSAWARELFWQLSKAPFVTVAALNGLAYGGGLELAMACTLRVAASHVRVSLPEIKLGLLPAYGGTQFLPTLVGPSRALDLMLTGRALGAQEALQMGLLSRVLDPGAALLNEAIALGLEVAQYSQVAIDAIRESVQAAGSQVGRSGLDREDAQVRLTMASADAREGVAAFLEKRAPRFRNA